MVQTRRRLYSPSNSSRRNVQSQGWLQFHQAVTRPYDWNLTFNEKGLLKQNTRNALVNGMKRVLKKKGHYQVSLGLPHVLTARASGVRMGKGKGKVVSRFGWIKKGSVFFTCQSTAKQHITQYLPFNKRSPVNYVLVKKYF